MDIKTLAGTDLIELLAVFNEAFSDYFVQLKLNEAQFKAKLKADNIDFDLSVGVFEDQKLIAFILHGSDVVGQEKVIYNGGTGVVPSKRGLGLTVQMYEYIYTKTYSKRNKSPSARGTYQ